MAGLVETVTERDAPRSRNTLDEEEEEEARVALHAKPLASPTLELHEGKELPQGADLGLITIGQAMSSFVDSCASPDTVEDIGVLDAEGRRASVRSIASGRVAWVALDQMEGIEERALWAWAKAAVGALGNPAQVCVLDTMYTYDYLCQGARWDPPHVRGLASSAEARATCKALGVTLLESGNLVTGLSAAVLGECTFAAPAEGCLALMSLRESQLGAETLQALVDPVLGLLRPLSEKADSSFVRDVADVREACRDVRERRGADRGLLYM